MFTPPRSVIPNIPERLDAAKQAVCCALEKHFEGTDAGDGFVYQYGSGRISIKKPEQTRLTGTCYWDLRMSQSRDWPYRPTGIYASLGNNDRIIQEAQRGINIDLIIRYIEQTLQSSKASLLREQERRMRILQRADRMRNLIAECPNIRYFEGWTGDVGSSSAPVTIRFSTTRLDGEECFTLNTAILTESRTRELATILNQFFSE